MKVLVIGNGFDLAHGFETKYIDFLEFVKQFNLMYDSANRSGFYKIRSRSQLKYLTELFASNSESGNNLIRELRKLTNDNIWISHFWDIMGKRGENWVDFEKEISQVVQMQERYFARRLDGEKEEAAEVELNGSIVFKNDIMENLVEENTDDRDMLKLFKARCTGRYLEHLNNLTRALEIYFTAYVMNSKKPELIRDILDIDLHEDDAIISFNYTDTYNRLYKQNPVDHVYFLHGKALIENTVESNDMVLGIDEYYKEDEEKNSKVDYVAFKKYFQRIIKGTTPRYKEIFEHEESEEPEEPVEMYIYGHSLDVTDKDVFKELLNKNVKVTVFSYNKETQKTHVSNLVQILGMESMISNTYNLDPKITFKLQT